MKEFKHVEKGNGRKRTLRDCLIQLKARRGRRSEKIGSLRQITQPAPFVKLQSTLYQSLEATLASTKLCPTNMSQG